MNELKTKEWEGRFFVDVVASEYSARGRAFKDVSFKLFREDMPEAESTQLLNTCGLFAEDFDDRDYCYTRSYVEETFNREQVKALRSFFSDWDGTTVHVSPADIPQGGYMGVGAEAVGGLTGFHTFVKAEQVPGSFGFAFCGYFDLRGCATSHPERQASNLMILCDLVRPYLANNQPLIEAFRQTLEGWEVGDTFSEKTMEWARDRQRHAAQWLLSDYRGVGPDEIPF